MWWRNGKKGEKEKRPGVPAWLQVVARVCRLVAPEMSDNIWCTDMNEKNIPGCDEWVSEDGGGWLMSGCVRSAAQPQSARNG